MRGYKGDLVCWFVLAGNTKSYKYHKSATQFLRPAKASLLLSHVKKSNYFMHIARICANFSAVCVNACRNPFNLAFTSALWPCFVLLSLRFNRKIKQIKVFDENRGSFENTIYNKNTIYINEPYESLMQHLCLVNCDMYLISFILVKIWFEPSSLLSANLFRKTALL